jgi:kinesin light chain
MLQEAVESAERALSIRESRLGSDHPDVAATLNNLATLYRKMGDLTRSRETSRRALDIEERNLGKDHPGLIVTLVNLGMVERLGKDLAASEVYLRRAVAISEAKLQPGQGDYTLAHEELEETLAAVAGPSAAPAK